MRGLVVLDCAKQSGGLWLDNNGFYYLGYRLLESLKFVFKVLKSVLAICELLLKTRRRVRHPLRVV